MDSAPAIRINDETNRKTDELVGVVLSSLGNVKYNMAKELD